MNTKSTKKAQELKSTSTNFKIVSEDPWTDSSIAAFDGASSTVVTTGTLTLSMIEEMMKYQTSMAIRDIEWLSSPKKPKKKPNKNKIKVEMEL